MDENIELIVEGGCSKVAAIDDDAREHIGKDMVIDVDDSWVNSMKEKLALKFCAPSTTFTICRVPKDIRRVDPDAYNPSIVSIGPFHRGSENLQAMEDHKWRYLHKVLNHGEAAGNDLKKYLKAMKEIEPLARNCYSDNIKMDVKEFVEMMLLDGCFIIQLLLQQDDFDNNDPIDTTQWMLPCIGHDLLLLENQLPFFVLQCLWHLIGQPRTTLTEKALTFFLLCTLPFKLDLKFLPKAPTINHLLHLVHFSIQPTSPATIPKSTNGTTKPSSRLLWAVMEKFFSFLRRRCHWFQQSSPKSKNKPPPPLKGNSSAVELQEGGVKFQRMQDGSFLNITFERGKMKMSHLTIDDDTNSFFKNILALEQCFPECGSHFTNYSVFMDSLVNTPRDVEILTRSGIIGNGLGSNEEVALLFNSLCRGINCYTEQDYLANVSQEIIQHTHKRWPRWRAKLVHDYFSNPWAVISLIAAIFVIFLTSVQTYYAVFS